MHKCSQLPPFKMNGEECTEGAPALRYNKSACVNWNQVKYLFFKIIIIFAEN